jgi:5'-nucleotidase
MRILLTNDDGIEAEGLIALAEGLSPEHEVWIFAPDRERSGVSHALTLVTPCKVRKLSERTYSCSGTPADCIILALLGPVGIKPDLVVAGINRGPNLGTDIVYSGTCGAAREATLCGIPAIAVSCCASRNERFGYGAALFFISRNLEGLAAACTDRIFVNVNAPSSDVEHLDAEWCSPCVRVYGNKVTTFSGPDGFDYCFLSGDGSHTVEGGVTDYSIVHSGKIALSPILVQPQLPAGFQSGRKLR